MITSATTPAQQAEFARRIAGKPYFAAVMGTALTLFGQKPGSGWSFYLLPGGALALRGGTATLCGELPAGQAGEEAAEELQGFLHFLRVNRLLSEQQALDGWQQAEPLLLWELPKEKTLPLPPAPPAELVFTDHPSMMPVSRLVFPDSEAEQEEFYSLACTSITHGVGCCRALLGHGTPVCTVGCYEQSDGEAYMAAGVTAPEWRGRGLAGWLIVGLANALATERAVRFASVPALQVFYRHLGFVQAGTIQQTTRKWE